MPADLEKTETPVQANPFDENVLTEEEILDEHERAVFLDGRRPVIDYGPFNPELFRRAAAVVHAEYLRLGRTPTAAEAHDAWNRIPLNTYVELYSHRGFRDILRTRGVSVSLDDRLTLEQLTALNVLTDPTDKRTIGAKMRQLGYSYATYQAWMRNPAFKQERTRRAKEALEDAIPVAHERLAANVDAGDQRAIEYLMAMKGIYSPQLAANQDAMKVVYAVLEAVERHVPDPGILRAILNDVQVAAKGHDIANASLTA